MNTTRPPYHLVPVACLHPARSSHLYSLRVSNYTLFFLPPSTLALTPRASYYVVTRKNPPDCSRNSWRMVRAHPTSAPSRRPGTRQI